MERQQRKKQPEAVRLRLLRAAAALTAERGIEAVTLDKVAAMAGVSKGGLLHHFPSRRALLEGLCAAMLQAWDEELEKRMAADPEPEGRFSRAYVLSATEWDGGGFDRRLAGAVTMASASDESLRLLWNQWLAGHVAHAGGNEMTAGRSLARAAADGLWLADYTGSGQPDREVRDAMVAMLIALTR